MAPLDWSGPLVWRELNRQRGRLVDLLIQLNEKNFARQMANTRLLKRRKGYVPKNNGRGRPLKKLKGHSKEDESRREKYLAEIGLIDQLLDHPIDNVPAILEWLAAAKKKAVAERNGNRTVSDRERKIDRLIAQFGPPSAPQLPPPGLVEWNERDVRLSLRIARRMQRARVTAVENRPIRTVAEQDRHDRERARLAVLERFLSSNHLTSAGLFKVRAGFIRDDCPVPTDAHDHDHYRRCWQEGANALREQLSREFWIV